MHFIDQPFRTVLSVLLLSGILLLTAGRAAAQEDTTPEAQPVRIVLQDGSSVVGYVEAEGDETIRFRTLSGVEMTISKAQVRSREVLSGQVRDGAYLRTDPNRTRLLFAPTARSLSSGQGYFADYFIFFPFVAYGVADVVSLAGGISLLPGLSPTQQFIYIAPKVTFYDGPGLDAAVGVVAGTAAEAEGYGGLVYGLGTVGDSRKAATFGVGFAFSSEAFEDSPALLLGGEYQVSNSIKLLTENYVLVTAEDGLVVSGGVRFFGDNLAADLALWTAPFLIEDLGDFPFLPWISFAYNFGP